ncbi:Detected protein of unknown function [Hibiscus syriacus]|uniref:Uncharacterized protein n=1 Tax=Hibiscus syriacus TaxID=106335 RepID=A0A6A2WK74_HIBSY|nr:uncharacterized protein LOC120194717 [Hibiscus syriacus]KAE8656445.1 Detected protein of unknown function [Hibiscus syriacus]
MTRLSRQQANTNKKQQQSRPSILFGSVGVAGEFVSLTKAKKEKMRRLCSVNGHRESPSPCPDSNPHCETEMGSSFCCDLSSDNTENQRPSHSPQTSPVTNSATNIFKIPKKFIYDCNVVNHASVPRKLRSAMKKRSQESISPPPPESKKTNHTLSGVEVHRKDGLKKPKLKLKQGELDWSRKETVSGPITKDEEEVVETLYALAGMFPDSDSIDTNKMNGEPIEAKPSAPPETVIAIEVKKEDANTVSYPQATEFVHPYFLEDSTSDAAKCNSLNETIYQDKPDLPESRKPHFEPDSSSSQMRPSGSISFLTRSEPETDKSSCIPGNSHVRSELTLKTGLKQQLVTNLFETKAEMTLGVTAAENQMAQQHIIKELGKDSLALLQSLALGSCTPGSSKSSANKFPAWLDAAMYGPRTFSLESGSSSEKVPKVTMDRKSMKRCATHVYISCLIRNLQMHNKDSILQQPLQLKPHTGLKQTALLYPKDDNNLRNPTNGNLPSSSSGHSATNRNDYEARNGVLQPKMVYQEQTQVASASGRNSSNKQTFDFLSLSAGGINVEVNNSSNKVGNTIESLSQLHGKVPYLHSFQQHSPVPFSIPASRYTDHRTTATQQVQLQLPQYPSNPFCAPPYMSHSGVTKQQQQRLWAAHRAAQYKTGTSTVLTQFPSWQNGKPESSTSMPYTQNANPPFSSLDAFGPKYNTITQHQLPKIAISSSLLPAKAKRSDHHLPSIYEESNGRLRASGMPLQLLCDERF